MNAFIFVLALAHLDSLPPNDRLFLALQAHHDRLLEAQLAEFDLSRRGQWMNYVPSIGIGYALSSDANGNLSSKPRPSISFSLAQVFSARRQRLDRLAKRRSIQAAADIALDNDHRALLALLARLQILHLELDALQKSLDIELQLFHLAEIDYETANLSPKDFLPKQKNLIDAQLALAKKSSEILALEASILALCHF